MFKKGLKLGNKRDLNKKEIKGILLNLIGDASGTLLKTDSLSEAKCAGEDMVSVFVQSSDMEPLAFRLGRHDVFPSLYLLWNTDSSFPFVFVNSAVSGFILTGAHLMLPGIIRGNAAHLPHSFGVGDTVAIRVAGNPNVIAIGKALLSRDEILSANPDTKGKAVEVLHYFGDCLWQLGSKTVPEGFSFDRVIACAPTVAAPDVPEPTGVESSSDSLSPEQMDSLAWASFYQVAKLVAEKELPFSSSALYSRMQSAAKLILGSSACLKRIGLLKLSSPESVKLDLKTASCKSFKVFLNLLVEKGFVSTKTVRDETVIYRINSERPEVKAFISPSKKEEQISIQSIVEVWFALNNSWASVFGPREGSRRELCDLLSGYLRSVKGPSVQLADHPSLRAVFKPDSQIDKQDMMKIFSDQLVPMHRMVHEVPPKIRRGSPPGIEIKTKRVSGNKMCTLVKGLSAYHISESDLVGHLSREMSVSVSQADQGIYLQGELVDKLVTLLTTDLGIPKEYIRR